MTSKERVLTAFEHKEADRVPMGEMHIMPHASSEILGRDAITGEGSMYMKAARLVEQGRRDEFVERFAQDTVDVVRKIGHDLFTTELDPPVEEVMKITEISENGWTEVDQATGHWRKFTYEQDKQIVMEIDSFEKEGGDKAIEEHIAALEESAEKIHESCFDSTRLARSKGKDLFHMAKIPNHIPSGRSWYTEFMTLALTEPELNKRLIDAYTAYGLAAAKGYVECGVDGVLVAVDWAMNSGPIMPPYYIEEFMVPQVNAIADYCHEHGVKVMKHSDGNIMPIADMFFDMHIDAFQSCEPYADMKLSEIKKLYGDKVTIMGNVDCGRTLPFGTEKEIVEETKQCLRDGAPGGGYILSSSNTIMYPIPTSALMTMVDTVNKFGQYPIDL